MVLHGAIGFRLTFPRSSPILASLQHQHAYQRHSEGGGKGRQENSEPLCYVIKTTDLKASQIHIKFG